MAGVALKVVDGRARDLETPRQIRAWEQHLQECRDCRATTAPADRCLPGSLIYAAARLAVLAL